MLKQMGVRAKEASRVLALQDGRARAQALTHMADALLKNEQAILAANAQDVANGQQAGLTSALIDRLTLTPQRVAGMADALRQVAALPDPVGLVQQRMTRPNGLRIARVSAPIGVIAVIFEARPNVTA
ncbi:MAG TPA: gamma-glutamyl-phosphate reductase, partial [Clostridiales bacterium]|nr:gamma-glutamyl-phosphate reductase [Clostridiales bacterium]